MPTLYLLVSPCSSSFSSCCSHWAVLTASRRQLICTSGATYSRISLVLTCLPEPRPFGMESSMTEPRSVSSSDVRTINRYRYCSLGCVVVGATSEPWRASVCVGFGCSFSRLIEIATGPRCSSIPNQFWCSWPKKYCR
uniref:Putative secreted protein n=1 Tax=Anopheles darlingi TaxID=43151 RepID=A0A2M4DFQ2_ANODA